VGGGGGGGGGRGWGGGPGEECGGWNLKPAEKRLDLEGKGAVMMVVSDKGMWLMVQGLKMQGRAPSEANQARSSDASESGRVETGWNLAHGLGGVAGECERVAAGCGGHVGAGGTW
jgi:hypothetical protein